MTATLPKQYDPECLIFVRHGETDWNAEGRMQGQTDIPLNGKGQGQAKENGGRLRTFFDEQKLDLSRFDFVASPLGRTRQTMELLRGAMGLDPREYRQDAVLMELTFGSWEGSTMEELADEEQDLVQSRAADKWGFVPPGGGESYEMLSKRIDGWLHGLNRPSVVVSHGGVFRVLRGFLEGLDTNVMPKLAVPQDKVFVWRDSGPAWI